MDLLGRSAGLQIGLKVCATKAIDGLLGVTDQHQRRVGWFIVGRIGNVDVLQRAILQLVGVLKLIDQCHGVLLTDQGRQATARCGECMVQALQQVLKVELTTLEFAARGFGADPIGGVVIDGLPGVWRSGAQGLEVGNGLIDAEVVLRCGELDLGVFSQLG